MEVHAAKRRTHVLKADGVPNPEVALKLFRHHLARADEILTDHAQRAMTEARGNAKRAAAIMAPLLKADAALQVELKALARLRSHVFPPIDKQWRLLANPNCRKRKSRSAATPNAVRRSG